jgi:2-haloacid dehalogenase
VDRPRARFQAVAFDLLTALVDSWSLWALVARDRDLGHAWRRASLQLVTSAGDYRPYDRIVHEAAAQVGLPAERAGELLARWDELRPWPEVPDVLARLRGRRLGIVTNCSQ